MSQDGSTTLIWASYFGHLKAVEALLADGADMEAKDEVSGQHIYVHGIWIYSRRGQGGSMVVREGIYG